MTAWGRFPRNWTTSKGILLYKKGDPSKVENWRPICLTSCAYRIIAAQMAAAMQELNKDDPFISPEQKGFIQGTRGCTEHTLKIQELLCHVQRTKQDAYLLTIDFKDAFGSIPHKAIWKAMAELGFSDNIISCLKESYRDTKVRFTSGESIYTRRGIKQGCPLSPLLFNLVLEKLLRALRRHDTGINYTRKDNTYRVNVQAYADDVILIANTKEDLDTLCHTLTQFSADLQLTIATKKCSLYSYIREGNRRVYSRDTITLNNQQVPNIGILSLSEYLGTPVSRSYVTRMKHSSGSTDIVIDKIQKLKNSHLRLNQVVDAIRKYIIPQFDYNMQCNPYSRESLEKVDTEIRKCLNTLASAPTGTPNAFFYTDWKDGGLSIPNLAERQDKLTLCSFIHTGFMGTESKFFKQMFKEEMKYRKTPKGEGFCNYECENGTFRALTTRGTETLAIKAAKSAHRLKVQVSKQDNVITVRANGEEKILSNTKGLLTFLKSLTNEQWRTKLTDNKFKGHSFPELQNNASSNFFFSPRHPQVNDNLLKFIYKARTNNLPTGEVLTHGRGNPPPCTVCHRASDTLMHRLNGCKSRNNPYKTRHNAIEQLLIQAIRLSTRQRLVINRSRQVRMASAPRLSQANQRFMPDLWYFDRVNNCIQIIEITVPYDSIDDNGKSKLKIRREAKLEKYSPLANEIRAEWQVAVHLHVIVVSSLGTVPKETKRDLLSLFRGDSKLVNDLTRSLALIAVRESALLYWGIARTRGTADNHDVNPAENDEGQRPREEANPTVVDQLFVNNRDMQPGDRNSDAEHSDTNELAHLATEEDGRVHE